MFQPDTMQNLITVVLAHLSLSLPEPFRLHICTARISHLKFFELLGSIVSHILDDFKSLLHSFAIHKLKPVELHVQANGLHVLVSGSKAEAKANMLDSSWAKLTHLRNIVETCFGNTLMTQYLFIIICVASEHLLS